MTAESVAAFMNDVNAGVNDGIHVIEISNGKYNFIYDANFNGVKDEGEDEVLASMEVDFIVTNEKGVFEITPGTGDAAMTWGGAIVAVIAIGGAAYLIFKKDEKED